jgi:hypothetical protein
LVKLKIIWYEYELNIDDNMTSLRASEIKTSNKWKTGTSEIRWRAQVREDMQKKETTGVLIKG